jgi:signal transduction histidine kinase
MMVGVPSRGHPIEVTPMTTGEAGRSSRDRGGQSGPVTRAIVLIVDEPGANLSRLAGALQDDRCDVVVAASAREATDLLYAQAIDCVVLPFPMADAEARTPFETREVPLFMILESADDALAVAAIEAGADDCATAAGDLRLVIARIRAVLRRRRIAQERLTTTAEAAGRRDAELVALNYAISHDLRAPLRAMDGFSRILLEECSTVLETRHIGYLQRIVAATRELNALIDDLLQLSRVGRAQLRRGPLDLSELAHKAASELRAKSDREVEVVIDDGLVVHADRTLMRQLVDHLIGNSWKFTAPTPQPRIEWRAERVGGETVFVVRDNGVGFDASRAEKLFRPFQRLHGRDFEGAGIGLAVVHKIIDRHGGRVWAEGRPGEGASIYFTVPADADGDLR